VFILQQYLFRCLNAYLSNQPSLLRKGSWTILQTQS